MTDAIVRQGNVQVYFVTISPDIELPEGKRQLLVPTSKDQSSIINCSRALSNPK
jgi:ribosome biogenesis protein YTM1